MEIILYIAAIIVMIWSIAVQGRLKRLVTKYSNEQAASGKTANDCVREMLAMNDVYGVTMDHVGGELTDNFNPKENKIYLSDSVDGGTSILPFKIRQLIAPFAGIASKLSVWIAIGGVVLMYFASRSSSLSYDLGYWICTLGITIYSVVFLFYLVTLPIERNASKRGLDAMKAGGWVSDAQLKSAKKVLWAAGDTYAVALAGSAVTLLRLLLLRGRGRRR